MLNIEAIEEATEARWKHWPVATLSTVESSVRDTRALIDEVKRWRRVADFLAADDGEDDPIPDAEWVKILVARAYKKAGTE